MDWLWAARRMASVVARCMLSLGSRISPKYSNSSTSVMKEQGEEVGKGAWMWKGGRVGPGQCWPPRALWREGVSKKAMTFVFCVLICLQFPKLHFWQTCNMGMSARSSTYSSPPIQICTVPLCCRPGARLITAWGDFVWSS